MGQKRGGVSAVLLNWQRQNIIHGNVLPALERCSLIDEIIISHGREDSFVEFSSTDVTIQNRKDWKEINPRYGLARRFIASAEARNDFILILDDDIIAVDESVTALYEKCVADPEILHGLFGRNVTPTYGYSDKEVTGQVTFVLTGFQLASKDMSKLFLQNISRVEKIVQRHSEPLWNGEDIFMAALALEHSGRLNQAYQLPLAMIPEFCQQESIALNLQEKHLKWRSKFSKHLIEMMKLQNIVRCNIDENEKKLGFPHGISKMF